MEEVLPMFPVFVTVHRLEFIEPSMQIAYPKSSTIIHTPRVVYDKRQERKDEGNVIQYFWFHTEFPKGGAIS